MLSRCFLDFSVGVGASVIGLSQISSFSLSSFAEFCSAVSEEKFKNVSANQKPGRPFCFSDRPEKHKLGRGR